MFTATSSHKRRRASSRADKARAKLPGRVVVNVAGLTGHRDVKGKAKEVDDGNSRAAQDATRRLEEAIQSHCFNHEIDILFPTVAENSSGPKWRSRIEQLQRKATGEGSVVHACVPLQLFLTPEFVSQYVRGSSAIALSSDTSAEDVICLDGQGTLILSLTKQTYQSLGLTGRPAHFARSASGRTGDRTSGPVTRYIVEIPLLDPTFVPGKPGWQRAYDRLGYWDKIRGSEGWPMVIAVEPGRKLVFDREMVPRQKIDHLPSTITTKELADIWIPALTKTAGESAAESYDDTSGLIDGWAEGNKAEGCSWERYHESLCELAEWSSLVIRESDCTRTFYRPSPLGLNSYAPPTPCVPGTITHLRLTGFVHSSMITSIVKVLQKSLIPSPSPPFVLIKCQGFAHSPIRWRSSSTGWGLAYGSGRPGTGKNGGSGQFQYRASEDDPSSGESSGDDGDDDDDEEEDDDCDDEINSENTKGKRETSTPALWRLTGPRARRARHAKVKRKSHTRKGQAERVLHGASANGSGNGGDEAGWGAVLFPPSPPSPPRLRGDGGDAEGNEEQEEEQEKKKKGQGRGRLGSGSIVWWENVTGDLRC